MHKTLPRFRAFLDAIGVVPSGGVYAHGLDLAHFSALYRQERMRGSYRLRDSSASQLLERLRRIQKTAATVCEMNAKQQNRGEQCLLALLDAHFHDPRYSYLRNGPGAAHYAHSRDTLTIYFYYQGPGAVGNRS